jgi:hypothetical protein
LSPVYTNLFTVSMLLTLIWFFILEYSVAQLTITPLQNGITLNGQLAGAQSAELGKLQLNVYSMWVNENVSSVSLDITET